MDEELIEKMKQARLVAAKEWKSKIERFKSENRNDIVNYFLGLPDTCKRGWYDCFTSKSTNKRAIKAKCLDCSNYQREEVVECTVKTCPLWNFRPFK